VKEGPGLFLHFFQISMSEHQQRTQLWTRQSATRTAQCQAAFVFASPNLPSFYKDRAHEQYSMMVSAAKSSQHRHCAVTRPNLLQTRSNGMPGHGAWTIQYDRAALFNTETERKWLHQHEIRSSGRVPVLSVKPAARRPPARDSRASQQPCRSSITLGRTLHSSVSDTQRMHRSGLPLNSSYRAVPRARARCSSAYYEPTSTRGLLVDRYSTPYTQGVQQQRYK